MIAIIDYGVGNLFSLSSSLSFLGLENKITKNAVDLQQASHIILPGVGAFGDAIKKLHQTGLVDTLLVQAADGKPLLGICLGMQLLFDKSYEYGQHSGLGLIPGEVCPFLPDFTEKNITLKVPHIGWNSLQFVQKSNPLLKYNKEGDYVYYVHSFYAKNCAESIVATSQYGVTVPGTVCRQNVYGCQFHPEKSGTSGLNMLKAFSEL